MNKILCEIKLIYVYLFCNYLNYQFILQHNICKNQPITIIFTYFKQILTSVLKKKIFLQQKNKISFKFFTVVNDKNNTNTFFLDCIYKTIIYLHEN